LKITKFNSKAECPDTRCNRLSSQCITLIICETLKSTFPCGQKLRNWTM